jgi:hypothetical protein
VKIKAEINKISTEKEIIKIKAEINDMETKGTIRRLNKTKLGSLKRSAKL